MSGIVVAGSGVRAIIRHMDLRGDLRSHGLRVTPQRVAVLEAMDGGKAMSAHEVHQAALDACPDLGLSTVYRTLIRFVDAGVVDEIGQYDGESTYRLCSGDHHHHLVCDRCRTVIELGNCDLEYSHDAIAAEHGFTVTGHSLTFNGLCRNCSAIR